MMGEKLIGTRKCGGGVRMSVFWGAGWTAILVNACVGLAYVQHRWPMLMVVQPMLLQSMQLAFHVVTRD
jgi:hypothetical protein